MSKVYSVKDMSFKHTYECDAHYSYAYTDFIILDYEKESQYPVWRVWVEYCGTKKLNIHSATFTLNGKNYTFGGLKDTDRFETKNEGCEAQTLMIKLGSENIDFIIAMEEYRTLLCPEKFNTQYVEDNTDITLTLHGETEDVTVKLPGRFAVEFFTMSTLYVNCGDISDYIMTPNNQTKLTVTDAN